MVLESKTPQKYCFFATYANKNREKCIFAGCYPAERTKPLRERDNIPHNGQSLLEGLGDFLCHVIERDAVSA